MLNIAKKYTESINDQVRDELVEKVRGFIQQQR